MKDQRETDEKFDVNMNVSAGDDFHRGSATRVWTRVWADGLARIAKESGERTHFWPVLQAAFCDEANDACGPLVPGTDVQSYMDDNHLTEEASFWLWPMWRREFVRAGLV